MGIGGWNLGGAAFDLLPTSLMDLQDQHAVCLTAFALQQVKRGEIGWSSEQAGKWSVVSYQNAVEWRGAGVAYDPTVWAVIKKKASPHGCWIRLRKVHTRQDIWLGSIYVPPHYTTGDLLQAVQDHQAALPATHLPTLLFGDTNAHVKWQHCADEFTAYGEDSKSRALLEGLLASGFTPNPPREDQILQPTSRPRKPGATGRVIDWMASKHAVCDCTQILTDSCYLMGTDHDMLAVQFMFREEGQTERRLRTGKRVVRTRPEPVRRVNQEVLKNLATQHTGPPSGQGYKDSRETKQLFARARHTKRPEDLKMALPSRKKAHQEWREAKVARASQGDWHAFRACRARTNQGWESNLASHLDSDDPHHTLHEHYSNLFRKDQGITRRSSAPPTSKDITQQELQMAMSKVKLGKSVGHDEVSMELFREIASNNEGTEAILAWYNSSILHTGEIPTDWHTAVMVLLPKTSLPKKATETRPISMGCTAEKIFCHIVLSRCKPDLQLQHEWQCAGENRQCADYIHTVCKLLECEREWQSGLAILKLDFAKAFDSVRRDALLAKLFCKLGDSEEFRIWEHLMMNTDCTLLTAWAQSRFKTDVGIRQGAIESPYFFSLLVEWVIEEVSQQPSWRNSVSTYQDLKLTQAAYMDDLLIWDGDCRGLEQRYALLRDGFAKWGLRINPSKCSLYTSPKHKGAAQVHLDGVTLLPPPVMGIPFQVGANSNDLLQPTWHRAKHKFWSIKHILCAKTSIGKRLKVLARVVGGCALWIVSPIPPEKSALQSINMVLYQCILWMLRLRKRDEEHWADFRKRGFRQAKQLVVLHLPQRWSTRWLAQWWGYMGHLARNLHSDSPGCSSILCAYRPLEWWRTQQSNSAGIRHQGRFKAKIHPLEERMNEAAQGVWREVAQSREAWKQCTQRWIALNDVPWNSGQQFAIEW